MARLRTISWSRSLLIEHGEAFAGKEWLALEELGLWVKQRVYAESNKRQLPQFGSLSGEGQFVFLRPVGSLILKAKLAGIEVFAGDRKLGETAAGRMLSLDLPAGSYQIKARKAGYREWRADVQVRADQRTEVDVDIEPLLAPRTAKADDGAEMVLVPAGAFLMGTTREDMPWLIEQCQDGCQRGRLPALAGAGVPATAHRHSGVLHRPIRGDQRAVRTIRLRHLSSHNGRAGRGRSCADFEGRQDDVSEGRGRHMAGAVGSGHRGSAETGGERVGVGGGLV